MKDHWIPQLTDKQREIWGSGGEMITVIGHRRPWGFTRNMLALAADEKFSGGNPLVVTPKGNWSPPAPLPKETLSAYANRVYEEYSRWQQSLSSPPSKK